jgi:hypothetical protein
MKELQEGEKQERKGRERVRKRAREHECGGRGLERETDRVSDRVS